MKSVHLDAIAATRVEGTLWKPIRSTLGVRAFGVNAYIAEAAGDVLFQEHDETEGLAGRQRHEELYIVLSGRAIFNGSLEAPAGTLVFFDDPAERRGARAAEAGTTVLAVGGPVGEAYEPGPWEAIFLERRARESGGA